MALVAGVFALVNFPRSRSCGGGAGVARVAGRAGRLRAFNVTMAVLLVCVAVARSRM